MSDEKILIKLNEIFFTFEESIFVNDGIWPRKVNLIFAFSDYIENMSDMQIADILKTNQTSLIKRFRFIARHGIENWLKNNMKTLMI